tara:strand:+ start:1178 stop:1741 length:564 start_codon:yes stop_codon:yes gene_type:complete
MEGQGKAVFDHVLNASTKAFLSSFIVENRHDLECTTPKFIIINGKQEGACIQGVEDKYAKETEQLVFTILDAWYSNQIVIVLTDSKKEGHFHVLKIARPQVLAPVIMNESTTRFATQSAEMKRDLLQAMIKHQTTKKAGFSAATTTPEAISQGATAEEADPPATAAEVETRAEAVVETHENLGGGEE